MQDKSDAQLLRDYAEHGNEAAFRELATRHMDLVYSAAVRQVSSPDLARDIAQSVFIDLARKAQPLAKKLPEEGSLAGWFHRATRYAALGYLRDTRRRVTNERQAMEQLFTNSETTPDWEPIRPMLDEALDSLGDQDREALLLRYFKNHDFRAVGLALGVSDDAAQKRVSRAVECLRQFFGKRGVAVGASGLATILSTNAVHAAPSGLAGTVSTAAASWVGTTSTATTTTTATVIKTVAMTTLQKTLITVALAAVAGAGIYGAGQLLTPRSALKNGDFQDGLKGWIADTNKIGLLMNPNGKKHAGDGYAMIGAGDTQEAVLAQKIRLDGKGGNYRLTFDFGLTGYPQMVGVLDVSVLNTGGDILASTVVSNTHPVRTYYIPPEAVNHERLDFKVPAGLSSVKISFADKTADNGIAIDPGIKNVRLKKLN
ncbi:MAG: RNA polymerase sigma factor [Limisphaerales bacterium]